MTAKAVAAGARIDFGWGRHWLPPSDLPSDSLVVLSCACAHPSRVDM